MPHHRYAHYYTLLFSEMKTAQTQNLMVEGIGFSSKMARQCPSVYGINYPYDNFDPPTCTFSYIKLSYLVKFWIRMECLMMVLVCIPGLIVIR